MRNHLSEEQGAVLKEVADWTAAVEGYDATPEALTAAIATVNGIQRPAVMAQAKTLLWRRAKNLGFDFDKAASVFRAKGMTPSVLHSEHEQAVMDADAGDAQEPPADRTPVQAKKSSSRRAGLMAVEVLAGAVKEAVKRGDADAAGILASGCARAARKATTPGMSSI